ncbi:HemK2/MTQ2 family protein methyltransferase [Spirillospora sp. CA-294931]|uniref:HemK2/MTQ2 family protein methyltransferase n=1 Tax=Spirillospora sp. CA-294931 TaxID=3240042 RepID=UPI003D929EBD
MRPPGVYRPQADTFLLSEALRRTGTLPGARVLDVCTGTGAVAVAAARNGARRVTAIDVSGRAVLAARTNARLHGLPVRVLRGDLLAPVAGEVFDVIVANPPYVLGEGAAPGRHASARAWNGGTDGRAVLDRLCALAPRHLAPGGIMLMVHSALCGAGKTVRTLRDQGLNATVVARAREPFGPVMRARAAALEEGALIERGQRHEDLVVIRAERS